MLAILNCQSEDLKSYRRSKRDGGKGEPHLMSSRSGSITRDLMSVPGIATGVVLGSILLDKPGVHARSDGRGVLKSTTGTRCNPQWNPLQSNALFTRRMEP
jgi:hypothetical protein